MELRCVAHNGGPSGRLCAAFTLKLQKDEKP